MTAKGSHERALVVAGYVRASDRVACWIRPVLDLIREIDSRGKLTNIVANHLPLAEIIQPNAFI